MNQEQQETLPLLSAEEQRVLGCLIEKSRTTPDYYPMTLNSLTLACNQKSSRKPIVSYDEETVIITLDSLKKKRLVSTVTGGGSRVVKYKHNLAIQFPLVPSDLAIVCLLLLRGSQTPGEINTNSGRLYEFESIEDVIQNLEKLAEGEITYVKQLPKRPGQKEARYAHLLGGDIEFDESDFLPEEPARKNVGELEQRLATVEQELAELKEAFNKLMKELMG